MKKILFILSICLSTICGHAAAPAGVEIVDLGLSVKWASCNVGAEKSTDYGDYFAWGGTEGYNSGKTSFDWNTYKYCNGKYNTSTLNDGEFPDMADMIYTSGGRVMDYNDRCYGFCVSPVTTKGAPSAITSTPSSATSSAPKTVKVLKNGQITIGNYNIVGQKIK